MLSRSLSPLPHMFITNICFLLCLAANFKTKDKAWAGSKAGIIPSNLQQILNALIASLSLA